RGVPAETQRSGRAEWPALALRAAAPVSERRARSCRGITPLMSETEDAMPRICALVSLLTLTPAALAEDWPQWLGPRRDGSTVEKVQPWKGDLKVLWKEPVSEGHSSPV